MAGIYIHIPFCRSKCYYCDFFSVTNLKKKDEYLTLLISEIELRKHFFNSSTVDTIYFGGGTPSLLMNSEISLVINKIKNVFHVANGAEITLEANPDDLTPSYLNQLVELGINRISIGIQSFHDQHLKLMNRRHTSSQALKSIQDSREAGLTNLSIDLIYGIPGMHPEEWGKNLEIAFTLEIPHISAYHLTFEDHSVFGKWAEKGKIMEVNEEESVAQYKALVQKASDHGYEHYEISNFCLPGLYSRHNASYWQDTPYLGLGPAAHSYNGTNREWNPQKLDLYFEKISQGLIASDVEVLSANDRFNDRVITSLRTHWGLSLDEIKKKFGEEKLEFCLKTASKYTDLGNVIVNKNSIRLSEKGMLIANQIMADMIWSEE